MTFWLAVRNELAALVRHPSARITVFLGALGYAFLYPLPYANQQPHEVPLAVVDHDASLSSRTLIQRIDATPQVSVYELYLNEADARASVDNQLTRGVLVIPRGYEREILSRVGTTVAYAGDGAYYLLYATHAEGIMNTITDLNEELAAQIQQRRNPTAATTDDAPFEVSMMNAFNTELGYRNYVVPAVFLLILHQLALMGVATMTWARTNELKSQSWWRETSVRWLAYMIVFGGLSLLYFVGFLRMYQIPIAPMSISFLLYVVVFFTPVIFLGQLIGRWVEHPQHAVVFVILSSMPIVFSAGFIWPTNSIPEWWQVLISVFPATNGINGMLSIQMYGVSIGAMQSLIVGLLLLSAAFASADFWLRRRLGSRRAIE